MWDGKRSVKDKNNRNGEFTSKTSNTKPKQQAPDTKRQHAKQTHTQPDHFETESLKLPPLDIQKYYIVYITV